MSAGYGGGGGGGMEEEDRRMTGGGLKNRRSLDDVGLCVSLWVKRALSGLFFFCFGVCLF